MKPSTYRDRGSGREYLRDVSSYLPYDLLRKTDTASMAVPIEVRSPFLSFEMIRSAFRTPGEITMPGGERKGLLKAVARRHLPVEIVDRPKMGFAIPIGEWFRTDYGGMRTLLLEHLNAPGVFPPEVLGVTLDPRVIRRMIAEHTHRRRDHSQRLYMLLVVAIWCRWLARTT
jgi:asparagine synthase (glutamine-hydrolysing)